VPETVAGCLARAIPVLIAARVLSPRLDAEVLLAHVLRWGRAALYARPEHELTEDQLRSFDSMVHRRAAHEPVPYITGRREFFALDLAVDRRVLIPRPETELLVERVLVIASRWPESGSVHVADIGTGSGTIAVSVAVNCTRAVVLATDVSAAALEVARENASRHGVEERIHFVQCDVMEPLIGKVQVIAANLPYVPSATLRTLSRDVVEYEPELALDGGGDGLRIVERLLGQMYGHLTPQGVALLEIGAEQGQAARALAQRYIPGAQVSVLRDYAGLNRVLEVQVQA
jgi:release factor glutamine methyltransferase